MKFGDLKSGDVFRVHVHGCDNMGIRCGPDPREDTGKAKGKFGQYMTLRSEYRKHYTVSYLDNDLEVEFLGKLEELFDLSEI